MTSSDLTNFRNENEEQDSKAVEQNIFKRRPASRNESLMDFIRYRIDKRNKERPSGHFTKREFAPRSMNRPEQKSRQNGILKHMRQFSKNQIPNAQSGI